MAEEQLKTKSFTTIVTILSLTLFFAPIATSQVQGPVSITFNSKSDFGPVVSADGSKVAFWSDLDGDPEIYVMNNEGTGLRQLTFNTANDTAPSISGDGGKVAFQADVGGPDFEIFVINSDGSGLLRLTSNNDEDMQPSLSSDGLTVAFISTGALDPAGSNPEGDAEIFVMRTDGTGIRQLTSNAADDTSPSISAQGSRIAYQSASLASSEIFIVNSDGTGRTRLTNNVDDDVSPSISANGGKVAFSSTGPAILAPPLATLANRIADAANPYEIFIVNSDGSGLNQLSSTLGDNFEPSLSGDGTRVAYVSTGDGDREIFIVDSDGRGLTQITNNLAFDFEPSISHSGGIVVFSSNLDGDFDIFRASLSICVLQGDANADGAVNILDLAIIGSSFGTRIGSPGYRSEADLNNDGSVDILDLAIVGMNFGQACP